MEIDIPKKQLQKVIDVIDKLDGMDFPELGENGNKMSDLFEITSILNDFRFALSEEMDGD